MSAAIKITRTEHTAAGLRIIASKDNDGARVRRLLALALVLDGHSREDAALQAGMERQTLRDWVHRYNRHGVAGLCSIRIGGRSAMLTKPQMEALKALTLAGPDPAKHKVVGWRCVDLRDEVARRFDTRSRNQRPIEGSHGASPQTPPGPTRAFARRAEPLDLIILK